MISHTLLGLNFTVIYNISVIPCGGCFTIASCHWSVGNIDLCILFWRVAKIGSQKIGNSYHFFYTYEIWILGGLLLLLIVHVGSIISQGLVVWVSCTGRIEVPSWWWFATLWWWLVGGLEHFLFFHILGIIIRNDSYFSEGLEPPTRWIDYPYMNHRLTIDHPYMNHRLTIDHPYMNHRLTID